MSRVIATRVEFLGCRMSGLIAPDSRWKDVRLSECKIDQASFRMSVWDEDRASGSLLADSDFYSAKFRGVGFIDCDLSRVDFTKAEFSDLFLHGSSLDDLKVPESLHGVVISSDQVVPMAVALFSSHGVRVDDDAIG